MNPSIRRFIVFNRLILAVALLALGFLLGFKVSWWLGWLPMLIAVIFVAAHFLIGPLTLMQGYMEAGDVEGIQKLLGRIKYPNLLYKPLRSQYYMLKGQMSMSGGGTDNLDEAEANLRKGLAAGLPEKEHEGSAYLQLGTIALQKGNNKDAMEHLLKAVKLGLPDADSKATALLQLASLNVNRRQFKAAKMYFARAKACKATNQQVVDQIKEMSGYMARIPG